MKEFDETIYKIFACILIIMGLIVLMYGEGGGYIIATAIALWYVGTLK